MKDFDEKLAEVRLGTSIEYRKLVEEAQEQIKNKLDIASARRELKLQSLDHKFEAEKQAIRQNFEVIIKNNYLF